MLNQYPKRRSSNSLALEGNTQQSQPQRRLLIDKSVEK